MINREGRSHPKLNSLFIENSTHRVGDVICGKASGRDLIEKR
jgi:hypothetical protein